MSEAKAFDFSDESQLQYPVLYNADRAAELVIDAPTVGKGKILEDPIPLPF
jgi:hypothetical protein